MKNKSQRGNVIWFLLIAIALLGMLTLILTRSGSNVDQAGDFEKRQIGASELLRYGKSIQNTIEQMKLRGVSENDISFEHDGTYTNAGCTVSDCKIFDEGGGGLTYRAFPDLNDGSDWIFTGANNVGTTANPVGTTAAATGNDLIMLLANVRSSLCVQINRQLGVGTSGTLPTETTGIDTTAFAGTFASGGPTILDGDPTPFELDGQQAGCFIDANDSNKVYFYYVVLAR